MFWWKKKPVEEQTRHEWVMEHDALEELDDATSMLNEWLTENAFRQALEVNSRDRHGNPLITVQHARNAVDYCKRVIQGKVL